MDNVVDHPGVIGLLLLHPLQDRCRGELVGIRLVRQRGGHVERQGVEDLRLRVVRITLRQRRHRRLVGNPARAEIGLAGLTVDKVDRLDVLALARRLRADGLRAVECGTRLFDRLLRRFLAGQRILLERHGDAPECNRATEILRLDRSEGFAASAAQNECSNAIARSNWSRTAGSQDVSKCTVPIWSGREPTLACTCCPVAGCWTPSAMSATAPRPSEVFRTRCSSRCGGGRFSFQPYRHRKISCGFRRRSRSRLRRMAPGRQSIKDRQPK